LTIREIMEARFPGSNLSAYFTFVYGCAENGEQAHHVAPRCEFPELENLPGNLVRMSYENHVHAHVLLSAAVPSHRGFRTAMLNMTRRSGQAFLEMTSIGGKKGGRRAVESGQLARARAERDREEFLATCRKGLATNEAKGWENCKKASAKNVLLGHPGKKALPKASHVRLHVNRGIVIPACGYCRIDATRRFALQS
jgi:hypothetical protein